MFLQVLSESARAITLPDGRSELKYDGSGLTPKHQGITITPNTGFTIKTKTRPHLDANESMHSPTMPPNVNNKFFINVCYHEEIEKPKIQKKLDTNDQEIEGLNVPVSIGTIRSCMDKAEKNLCMIVDVILSNEVEKEIEQHNSGYYKHFICNLVIESVERKYKDIYGPLDRQYKLPKTSYFGYIDSRTGEAVNRKSDHTYVPSQCVRDCRSRPTIEEVTSSLTAEDPISVASHASLSKLQQKPAECHIACVSFHVFIESSSDGTMSLSTFISKLNSSNMPIGLTASKPFGAMDEICSLTMPLTVEQELLKRMKVLSVIVRAVPASIDAVHSIQVEVCPYFVYISGPNCAKTKVVFPFLVIPQSCTCMYMEGCPELEIKVQASLSLPMSAPDIGTSQWALQQVCSSGKRLPMEKKDHTIDGPNNSGTTFEQSTPLSASYSHDPYFLLRNSHPAKGDVSDIISHEAHCLPEDRFHAVDALSKYYLEQQEEGRKNRDPENGKGGKACVKSLSPVESKGGHAHSRTEDEVMLEKTTDQNIVDSQEHDLMKKKAKNENNHTANKSSEQVHVDAVSQSYLLNKSNSVAKNLWSTLF